MTRDEIIKMAREAGFGPSVAWKECTPPFERFAALVAAAERERLTHAAMLAAEKAVDAAMALEREACAKVCEDTDIVDFEHCMVLHEDAAKTLTNAAAAIRARSAT